MFAYHCTQKYKQNTMQIFFNLHLFEYTTQTTYLMFKLMNFITGLQIFTHFACERRSLLGMLIYTQSGQTPDSN